MRNTAFDYVAFAINLALLALGAVLAIASGYNVGALFAVADPASIEGLYVLGSILAACFGLWLAINALAEIEDMLGR